MRLALASRWFAPDTPLETAARRTRELGLDLLTLQVPGPVLTGPREAARSAGVSVCAVVNEGQLAAASSVASTQRSSFVVVEGGELGDERTFRLEEEELLAALRRRETPDPSTIVSSRKAVVEEATAHAARVLHGALHGGAPLALRNAGSAADLLLEPTTLEWLLSDLPRLGFCFDPARARRAWRLGLGPEPEFWADRFASRACGVFVHGLGSDLAGHSHPEDDAPDWRRMKEALPNGVPWVIDVAPSLTAGELEDAIRYLRSVQGGR